MVTSDDPRHAGQADARALEVLVAMQSLERDEELAGILLIKAGAVIADVIGATLRRVAEGDMRLGQAGR